MALHSASDICTGCGAQSSSYPFCEKCHAIKEIPDGFSAFEIMGVPVTLNLSEEELRARYYTLSKQVHPDRYVGHPPREAMAAARWSTRLNKAYQELRDSESRSLCLLERFKTGPTANSTSVPLALAETYFEVQEALEESGDTKTLMDFQKQLETLRDQIEKRWTELSLVWKTPPSTEQLAQLRSIVDERRYLKSMLADVIKKLEGSR